MSRVQIVSWAMSCLLLLAAAIGSVPPRVAHAEDAATQAGNPLVLGIAAHAWWLDLEVYGEQLFPALDDLGVTTVRIGIDWKRFEPVRGQYDWALYDRVFGELARRHIVIVADFNTIPAWASTDAVGCADEAQEIYTCQLREDRYSDYENAVRAAVSRYAWVQYWEFWNEPEMWRYLGQDATVYLRHLRTFYDIAHQVNPEVVVAAQTLVGAEYMEYVYNLSAAAYGEGNVPWDAISIHPYVWDYSPENYPRPLEVNYDRIMALRQLMVQRGDGDMKMWITEYGWNNGVENQTRNLVAALDWMRQQPFIQFAHLHMLHDWNEEPLDAFGLMRILPDRYGVPRLTPQSIFAPKQPFYDTFKNYPRGALPNRPENSATRQCFPVTGQCVSGRFLKAWQERGALEILGYPLTRPYPRQQDDGTWLLVQDFERARLEFHPEYLGEWGEVLGTLAGNAITIDRRDEAPFVPLLACASTVERVCFPETGHTLAYGFRAYWDAHGGLKTFGYPISEEFQERNHDTGETYTVQYFERARFEYHPENAGTPYEILLGRLIANELDADNWLFPAVGSLLPTGRSFQ